MCVCVCACSCVYSRVRSRCLVCRPSHLCACRVGRRHPSSKLRPSSTAHAHTHKIQSRTSSQHGPKITGVEVRVEPSLATGSASGPGSVVACGPSIHYTEWNSRYDKDTIPKDTRSQPIHWPAAEEKRVNRNQPSSSCWRMFRSYSAWGHGRKGVARRGHRGVSL